MLNRASELAKTLVQKGNYHDAVRIADLGLAHFAGDENPSDDALELALELEDIVRSHGNASSPPFVSASQYEKAVKSMIGITPGENNEKKILTVDYPALISYIAKSPAEMEMDFALLGANPVKTAALSRIYAEKGPLIARDIALFGAHLQRTLREQRIDYIVSFERDMDIMSTGFEAMQLPNVRAIITTDKLGGKKPDSVYSQVVKILESVPMAPEMRQLGPVRKGVFQQLVKNRIRDLYSSDLDSRFFMDAVYRQNIVSAINGPLDGKAALFADVGFKGTIPYFAAAMFEEMHTNARAFVSLFYTVASPRQSGAPFAKYVPAFTSDEHSYKRHNNENIVRLLVGLGDPTGKRQIRRIATQDDLHDVYEVCLRHHYAAQAPKYRNITH